MSDSHSYIYASKPYREKAGKFPLSSVWVLTWFLPYNHANPAGMKLEVEGQSLPYFSRFEKG